MESLKKPSKIIVPLESKLQALRQLDKGANLEDLAKIYLVQPGTIIKWQSQRKSLKKLHGNCFKRPKNQLKMPVFLPVAEKIKALEEIDNGATYEEIAEKLNVRPNTVHSWEVNRKTLLNSWDSEGTSKKVVKRKRETSENSDEVKKTKAEDFNKNEAPEEEGNSPFMKPPVPMEAKLAALQKMRAGATRAQVAKEFNVSENTVYKWRFNKKLIKMLYSGR